MGKINDTFFSNAHCNELGAQLYGLISTRKFNGVDPKSYRCITVNIALPLNLRLSPFWCVFLSWVEALLGARQEISQ